MENITSQLQGEGLIDVDIDMVEGRVATQGFANLLVINSVVHMFHHHNQPRCYGCATRVETNSKR